MSDGPRTHAAAMEGKGYYNRHAAIPASGGSLAIPLLESAAKQIELNSGDRPIVIADYGHPRERIRSRPCARQLQPSGRASVGSGRFLCATLTFRPTTSAKCSRCWRAIRKVICKTKRRSFHMRSAVRFPGACFRPVTLISDGVPTPPSGSAKFRGRSPIISSFPASTGAVRAEFDRQAGQDWEAFLALRAAELRAGGRSGCRAAWARSRREDGVHFDDGPGKRRTP